MLTAKRWLELWQRLGAARSADGALAEEYSALISRYAEKHRHYHTARHIAECLGHFDDARTLCTREAEVELALWFHDAVYAPRAKDNEAESAAWAVRVMQHAEMPPAAGARVHALILKTCHDALPETPDEQVLIDIDLAILGADTMSFDEYERDVRAEYGWVPAFIFRRKRREVLESFLAREAIYATAHFRDRLEKKARENLARSLLALN